MDITTVKQILLEELDRYTGEGLNDYAYLTTNEAEQIYTIVDIATVRGKRLVSTVLVVRLVNDQIVIELDQHDKMLVDTLKARGVPESQIVLAYRGDTIHPWHQHIHHDQIGRKFRRLLQAFDPIAGRACIHPSEPQPSLDRFPDIWFIVNY